MIDVNSFDTPARATRASVPQSSNPQGSNPQSSNGWSRLRRLARRIAGTLAFIVAPLCISLSANAVTLLGPVDPSVLPLGTSYACTPACNNPAAPNYGRTGGQTWTFAAVPLRSFTSVWHGPVNGAVKLSFLANTFAVAGEVLTYDSVNSNPAGGILVFSGQTKLPANVLPPATTATPVFTRVTLKYTNTSDVAIALVTAASIGAPPGVGLVALLPNGFKLNFLVEASYTNGSGYVPALNFYDAQTDATATAFFDFTTGFYWNNVSPTLTYNTGTAVVQGAAATITNGMLRAEDLESPPTGLTFTIPSSGGGTVHNGTLAKSGNPLVAGSTFTQDDINNNRIVYTNNNSCETSDNFQFSVSDANGGVIPPPPGPPTVFSFPITINLVNAPPVANNASIGVGLGAARSGTLTATNNDCFTPAYTFSLGTLPTKGTVVLNNASTGAYTYTATTGQTGADSFTFNVTDGVVSSTSPGVISITIANQPPVAQNQTLATTQGVAVPGTLTATDTDQPPQALTYSIVANGAKGTAVVSNSSTGAFTYTPAAGRIGADTFTFKANDGSLDSNAATVTINIRGTLTPGRLVVTAGQVLGKNKEVVLVDPVTADQSVLASFAGASVDLKGIAIESTGKILATDVGTGSLLRIDPTNGSSVTLAPSLPGFPLGLGLEPNGNILVATGPAGTISRRNPVTGAETTVFSGGFLAVPTAVTTAPNGDIFVTDAGGLFAGTNRVIKIDPVSGTQTLITSGGNMLAPVGIVRNAAGDLFVTDSPQAVGQPTASSQVIKVDPAGAQTVVVNGGTISAPVGIAIAADGTLLTANFIGNAIVRINLTGPVQSVVSAGGELTGAFGLALVAPPPTVTGVVSRKTHGAAGVFDLPLSLLSTTPTSEPRLGPAHVIVFQFDKPVVGGTATVTEGTAGIGTVTFAGNQMTVNLTGVNDQQYVTVAISNVVAADGGTGGSGTVRIGFLLGDVNGSRLVNSTDILTVKASSGAAASAVNYKSDLNASGLINSTDILTVKASSGHALPLP